jgi:RNase H-like domain found in reverse transcriptase
VHALKIWRVYLDGNHFTVVTDHHSLRYLQTQPSLSRRQARWSEELQEYDFDIIYKPGRTNVPADALSRRPDLKLETISTLRVDDPILTEIRNTLTDDKEFGPTIQRAA